MNKAFMNEVLLPSILGKFKGIINSNKIELESLSSNTNTSNSLKVRPLIEDYIK